MKTLQEAFIIMYKHLHSMEEISTDDNGDNCMYRGCNGNKCVVGALIDDEHYSEEIEGKAVSIDDDDKEVLVALEASGYPTHAKARNVYSRMQDIHDFRFDLKRREEYIEKIAIFHELSIPTLEN